jgi:uncharacterized protein YecT (DUF1311 family)
MKRALCLMTAITLMGSGCAVLPDKKIDRAPTSPQTVISPAAHDLKTDQELNQVYRAVLRRYKNHPVFLEKLEAAQRAWLTFREAQFRMRYPHDQDGKGGYGSVFPTCAAQYHAQLNRERIATLRQWLRGVQEGDVCAGSILTRASST